jgi:hypothetical protein
MQWPAVGSHVLSGDTDQDERGQVSIRIVSVAACGAKPIDRLCVDHANRSHILLADGLEAADRELP